MRKFISILVISLLITFLMTREGRESELFGADTTVTVMDLTELDEMSTNDYLIVVDSSAGVTKRISANGAIIAFLNGKTIDTLEVGNFYVDTLQGVASPITILDTLNVTGQVNATYLKGDSTYTPIIVVDTVKSNVEITGYLNVPTDSLKINSVAITKSAAEINTAVDSVSVFSARSLANSDSVTAHRTDINTNVDSIAIHRTDIDANADSVIAHRTDIDANADSVSAISSRSLSNKDTLDTYIDGITYSKDLYDTGVTVEELDIMDGVTASTSEINNLDVAGSRGELEASKSVTLDANKKVNDWFVVDTLKTENNLQTPVLIYNMPTVSGTADSIDLDYTSDIHSIVTGMKICFIADSSNTGNCTITIDGVNEKSIIEANDLSELEGNDIRANMVVELIYDGTKFQMTSQSGN